MFSFGGSKSKSTSQSTSEAEGYSTGRSVSGSSSISDALATSRGISRSTQSVYGDEFMRMLYGGATGATMRAATLAPQFAESARALFTGGTRFLEQLGGGAGADYLQSRLEGGGLADERIEALSEDVGRFLRTEALPGVQSRAISAYGLGGARQGLAEGRAIEGATREFRRGATEIRGQEQAARDAIASQLMAGEQAGAAAGLSALPSLLGIADAERSAELAPYQQLSQILGGPTTLTESMSEQTSESIAQSLSEQFGISLQDARNWAKSQSTSTSRGASFDFGFST